MSLCKSSCSIGQTLKRNTVDSSLTIPLESRFYKFKSFVDIYEIDWEALSANPVALYLSLEQQSLFYIKRIVKANIDKIDWQALSKNPAAIHLLVVAKQQSLCAKRIVEANQDKINWQALSKNPAAIHLLVVAEQQSLCA